MPLNPLSALAVEGRLGSRSKEGLICPGSRPDSGAERGGERLLEQAL